jgi:hypothetical protein
VARLEERADCTTAEEPDHRDQQQREPPDQLQRTRNGGEETFPDVQHDDAADEQADDCQCPGQSSPPSGVDELDLGHAGVVQPLLEDLDVTLGRFGYGRRHRCQRRNLVQAFECDDASPVVLEGVVDCRLPRGFELVHGCGCLDGLSDGSRRDLLTGVEGHRDGAVRADCDVDCVADRSEELGVTALLGFARPDVLVVPLGCLAQLLGVGVDLVGHRLVDECHDLLSAGAECVDDCLSLFRDLRGGVLHCHGVLLVRWLGECPTMMIGRMPKLPVGSSSHGSLVARQASELLFQGGT